MISPIDSYQLAVLPNGLRVVTVTLPHTLAVSFSLYLASGARYESDLHAGISHYVEHIVFKGTGKWPSARLISEAVEGVGGHLNASTGKELVNYWARVPAAKLELAAEVICSLVRDPILDPTEVEKERSVILEELDMALDDPQSRISMLAEEVTFPDHPLGRDTGGTRESLHSIDRDALAGHIGKEYVPPQAVVAVAGPPSHDEMVAVVERFLGDWKNGAASPERLRSRGVASGQAAIVEKRATEQANMCLTMPGIAYEDPDRWALGLLNVILGDGMSSRLFQRLREELALTYSVYSFSLSLSDQGFYGIYAGVNPKRAPEAVDAILLELGRLETTLQQEELDRAKEYTKGSLVLGTEDTRGVVGWVGRQQALVGRIVTIAEALAMIERVNLADLGRVAARIFKPANYRLAVLGPFESEAPFLAQLGAAK